MCVRLCVIWFDVQRDIEDISSNLFSVIYIIYIFDAVYFSSNILDMNSRPLTCIRFSLRSLIIHCFIIIDLTKPSSSEVKKYYCISVNFANTDIILQHVKYLIFEIQLLIKRGNMKQSKNIILPFVFHRSISKYMLEIFLDCRLSYYDHCPFEYKIVTFC